MQNETIKISSTQQNSLAALIKQANWLNGYFFRQAERIMRKDND